LASLRETKAFVRKDEIMKGILLTVFCAGIALLSGLMVVAAEKDAGKSPKPCVAISGTDSHVKKPRYLRITSSEEWAKVWKEHKGEETNIDIDFDRFMVLAVFQGETVNSAGVTFYSMTEEGDKILFKYLNHAFQTLGGADAVTVYGFFVVPQSKKSVVLIDGTRTIPTGEIRWDEKGTIPKR
jgi:hypothetical protein